MVWGVDKQTGLPPSWAISVWPEAWDSEKDVPTDDLELVQVGYALLPTVFHVVLTSEEFPNDLPEAAGGVIYMWAVQDGDIVLREMYGVDLDLSAWLERVMEVFPVSSWRNTAKSEMARFLASDENRQKLPEALVPPKRVSVDLRRLSGTNEGTRRQGKRYKITDQHLDEVVRIYTEAAEQGIAPTREVAEVFGVAHSTAAKWVGTARSRGKLEQAGAHWGKKKSG